MKIELGPETVYETVIRTKRDFVITYISMFIDELTGHNIITPGQKGEIHRYMGQCLDRYLKISKEKKQKVRIVRAKK